MINWIDVKEKHFAKITIEENAESKTTTWESELIDTPFLVAIPTNGGWCIQQVVLSDGLGLQCWSEEEGAHYFGYDILDVTHWSLINEPSINF